MGEATNKTAEQDNTLEDDEKLKDVKVEEVDGDKEGSTWLLVNETHFSHKSEETKDEVFWKCAAYQHFKCPFRITTRKKEHPERSKPRK